MAKAIEHEMNDRLGQMMHAEPFQTFDVKTADGDTIRVIHPDFISRSPTGGTAVIFDPDNHMRIVNVDLIVTIEPVRSKPTRNPAGKK